VSEAPLPSYYRIKAALLAEIGRGEYMPGQSFVTEREVCARFGVSRITAVRALSDLAHDGVLTRHRGRGTFVTRLPELPPGSEAAGTRLVGCIFTHLHGHHPMAVIRGIEHVCRDADYNLLLFDAAASPRLEAETLQRARKAGVCGLIVYPVDGFTNAGHFETIRRDGLPLVMVDRYYPAVPTDVVAPDNVAAAQQLTAYLIGQGHTSIAAMWGEEVTCTSVTDRLAGYHLALREHGLPLIPELAALRPYTALPPESRRALLRSWLSAPYRPTAYLAVNSRVLGVVAIDLLSLGVRLPEDAALAAMDNASLDTLLALAVATVTLPSYKMGRAAMTLLLERLRGPSVRPAQHIVLPVEASTTASVALNLRRAAL